MASPLCLLKSLRNFSQNTSQWRGIKPKPTSVAAAKSTQNTKAIASRPHQISTLKFRISWSFSKPSISRSTNLTITKPTTLSVRSHAKPRPQVSASRLFLVTSICFKLSMKILRCTSSNAVFLTYKNSTFRLSKPNMASKNLNSSTLSPSREIARITFQACQASARRVP